MKLIDKKEAAAKLRCHPEHLMRLARTVRGFPQPVKLTASDKSKVLFDGDQLDQWIAERAATAEFNAVMR
jgi:hypothetical protein